MSRPAVREIGDRNAYWHHQETGFGSWLWIYQGRGRTGILFPPQWHRRRLRRPAGWRKGSVRNRVEDRKSTRLNSSHVAISYAVFCLKKKKKKKNKRKAKR